MDPSRELHRVPAPWDPSRELHRVPAHGYLGGPHSWKAEFSLGPHSAFRRIAPNGNSTDGRQTFFQPARFADVCIMLAPMDPRLCARVPARSSNQSRPAGDCIMLARSALITRWNSNQVPWDPSRELHRVPAPMDPSRELQPGPLGSMVVHHAGPAFADVHPMFADVCIRSPNVCRRLHTFTQCLPTSAYFWPWDPWLCILPARSALITRWNSNQVPWDPSRELHRVPARRGLHHAGPVGVDHSMELQPGPLDPSRELHRVPAHGSKVVHHAGPWIHGCAYFRPWDPWLCIMLAHGSMVVHTSGPGIHGCASCWPGRR
jgi:hypothetical protein